MKKSLLIKLHLYCGLFTWSYLIAFGVSSIILNHNIKVENTSVKRTWESMVTMETSLDDMPLAESVSDQLGLMGWLPPWQFQRDSASFRFQVTHFGKTNQIAIDFKTSTAEVQVMPKGFVAVLHGLHFFNGKIPNAPFFLRTWMVYQWLALLVLFISLILGIWLWLKYSYRTWEFYVFGGVFVLSIFIMCLL